MLSLLRSSSTVATSGRSCYAVATVSSRRTTTRCSHLRSWSVAATRFSDHENTGRREALLSALLTGGFFCGAAATTISNHVDGERSVVCEGRPLRDSATTVDNDDENDDEDQTEKTPAPPEDYNMFDMDPPDYSLLPEKDEPTNCSICQINRKGPCRDPWRWFEKCMKDNRGKDDDDDDEKDVKQKKEITEDHNPCAKAMMNWFTCREGHREIYMYYINAQYQPELDVLERNVRRKDGDDGDDEQQRRRFPARIAPSVDVEQWEEARDALDDGVDIMADVDETNDDATSDADDDPDAPPKRLIPAYARFHLTDAAVTGYPVEIAYVRDQSGTLLGFDDFSRDKQEGLETADMTFHLTPETTSLTVFALYREEEESTSEDDDKDKDDDDRQKKDDEKDGPKESTADDDVKAKTKEEPPEPKQVLYMASMQLSTDNSKNQNNIGDDATKEATPPA